MQEPDPFVETANGRSSFRIVDLLDLSRILRGIQKEDSTM
jgi:hypothetical protein